MKKITRRQFLKGSAMAGAYLAAGGAGSLMWPRNAHAFANSPQLSKWVQAMRQLDILKGPLDNAISIPTLTSLVDPAFNPSTPTRYYQVTAGEFSDQLHPSLPATKLWGYADATTGVHRHLGGVVVANRGTAARIRFTNTLPTPHLVPVDITIPGANQAQDRMAIHLHGGLVPWISDGGPHDWWSPTGQSGLSFLNGPGSLFDNLIPTMVPGQADYFYPNDQSTRLVWYHDHAWGITRINAYAGLASGYLILDAVNTAYTTAGSIPPLASTYPLVFQDKIFVNPATIGLTDPTWATVARPDVQGNGSLWYAHVYDPKLYRLLKSNKNLTPPNPSCVPEFFGDTMLANGLVYPTVTVEAKRYRFFVLNACNARFLNINLFQVATGADVVTNPKTGFAAVGTALGPPIIQIGNEAGFLVTETTHPNGLPFNPATFTGNLLLAPAERADIIIDFTGKAGMEFMMYSDAPGPFPVGAPTNDYYLGNPKNPIQPLTGTGPDTRNILKIKVVTGASDPQPAGAILNPLNLDPQPLIPYTTTVAPIPPFAIPASVTVGGTSFPVTTRDLTLNEDFDTYGRLLQRLGTTAPALVGKGFGLDYMAASTENVTAGTVEVWRIFNLTADTHPIHFHLVNVQVMSRQPFKVTSGVFTPTGLARGPEPNEVGWKETVEMHPGEVTSVIMKFDLPASLPFTVPFSPRFSGKYEYVWHCHILEHEEHDMMRPLVVTP
jgi:spore coat protein A, manganese oxidase